MKNGGTSGDKNMGSGNTALNPNRRLAMIDALTLPLRWLAVQIMLRLCPDTLEGLFEEPALIVRRMVERAISTVGLEGPGATRRLNLELRARVKELRPQELRALTWFTVLFGFQSRDTLWASEYEKAVLRRM